MTNSPEMVITVLALSKLAAVPAMINTNLRGTHLRSHNTHRLTVSRRSSEVLLGYLNRENDNLHPGPGKTYQWRLEPLLHQFIIIPRYPIFRNRRHLFRESEYPLLS